MTGEGDKLHAVVDVDYLTCGEACVPYRYKLTLDIPTAAQAQVDPEIDPDIPALIGASAAVALAGIPFNGPIGAARVGYVDGAYLLNPTKTERATSKLDLIVAGTEAAVLMVESEAHELPEEVMLGAVMHGHQQMQAVIELIHQLVEEAGKPLWDWKGPARDEALIAQVTAAAERTRSVWPTGDHCVNSVLPSPSGVMTPVIVVPR